MSSIPHLDEALSSRESTLKDEKFNQTRVWLQENLAATENADHRYLLACLDAKGIGLTKPDYLKAGALLLKLPSDYNDEAQLFMLHSEDLVRICEANTEAAISILKNKLFFERLVPHYLARIAEVNEEMGAYVLKTQEIAQHLDSFDVARMGVASLTIANTILSETTLREKLTPWGLAWLGESRPEIAKSIFENEAFSNRLDAGGIYRIGVRYKPIGKLILENEKLLNRMSVDQAQRLKASVEK